MPDALNPFSPEDFDKLEQAIAKSNEIERAIKKAQSAGVDVGDQLTTNRETRDKLMKIKQTYSRQT